MRNSIKILKPKANTLVDFLSFLQSEDIVKNQVLGNALSELMEKETFPPPIQRFFDLPKFKELVDRLKEGTLDAGSLQSKEIHSLQLLLESFHKLVHLDYDYEEIEHPVVQAKVLEQNIQDYLACISLFYPYESTIINDILSNLFQAIHFFTNKLQTTVLENSDFFSNELISFMDSPILSLLIHLGRSNYKDFHMEEWYPIAIELNIDAKLELKKHELSALAKGNAHKILNQLQTILSDMSRIYLKTPPTDIASAIKEAVLTTLTFDARSGQKVNELFYLEFWKEPYEILLTKEKGVITKLNSLSHRLWPLKESLYELARDYEFALPKSFSFYLTHVIHPSQYILSILGNPNLVGAELTIGFYNTQYEYLNEILSANVHKNIPESCKERIELLIPTLVSFLETYYLAKPLTSFHVIKNRSENLFSAAEAFADYSIEEIKTRIEDSFSLFIPTNPPPFPLLEAGLNKIIQELRSLLKEAPIDTVEYMILKEKLFSLEHIDLPSFAQTWHTLGEILGVIFIYMARIENSLDLFHNLALHAKMADFSMQQLILAETYSRRAIGSARMGSCIESELMVHEPRKDGVFAANGGYERGLFIETLEKSVKNLFSLPFFQVIFHKEII